MMGHGAGEVTLVAGLTLRAAEAVGIKSGCIPVQAGKLILELSTAPRRFAGSMDLRFAGRLA